jgi:diaminohydroxyphosphoribosylaminopyrimidine deaminase/5-amino-6-(5-phosphoribosylamino)uracil reductase
VVTDRRGLILGEGYHRGAGTPHAEAAALADVSRRGNDPAGAVVYVTLEPCNHQGRTGPCSHLLANAGVKKVVYALTDPNPGSTGGGRHLTEAGVEVEADVDPSRGIGLNRAWAYAVANGRPYVTLKLACSLDGRVAAPDGSSQWITGPQARLHAHAKRAEVDAVMVGTGTFFADRPLLTARQADGSPYGHQPLRVVVGATELDAPEYLQIKCHEPGKVLRALAAQEVRHVLLEGGPTLASAFLRAGVVDQIDLYLAPAVLGGGLACVADLGIESVDQALRWRTRCVERLGNDVFVELGR